MLERKGLKKLKNNGLKNTYNRSTFLYLNKIQSKNYTSNNGTIVFSSKSTYEKRNVNFKKLIEETQKLFPGPYTVSIYHRFI